MKKNLHQTFMAVTGVISLLASSLLAAVELPDNLTLNIEIEGQQEQVELYKYSMRAKKDPQDSDSEPFKVRLWSDPGLGVLIGDDGFNTNMDFDRNLVDTAVPPVRTFRGHVVSKPNIQLIAVIMPDGTFRASTRYQERSYKGNVKEVNVTDQLANLKPGLGDGKDRQLGGTMPTGHDAKWPAADTSAHSIPPKGTTVISHLAADVMNDVIEEDFKGDWKSALYYAEFAYLNYHWTHARETGNVIELNEMVMRLDNHTNDSWLGTMRTYWKGFRKSDHWDYAHQFIRQEGSGIAGSTGIGGGRLSIGYIFHEIGHNMGESHEHKGILNTHRRVGNRSHKRSYQHDTPSANNPTPLHPFAFPDFAVSRNNKSVDIDVLDNDYDTNGHDIELIDYNKMTKGGGTVQEITIEGRDALRYTPKAGFVGKDTIHYTVQDVDGLHTTQAANLYVHGTQAKDELGEIPVPIGHWTMDEVTNENLMLDSSKHQKFHASLLYNASGNGRYPGRLRYEVVPGVKGNAVKLHSFFYEGQAITFDKPDMTPEPSAYEKESTEAPASSNNFFMPVDNSLSISLWFKREVIPKTNSVELFKTGRSMGLGISQTSVSLYARPWSGVFTETSLKLPASIKPNTWHHITMVYDNSTFVWSLWLDGRKLGESESVSWQKKYPEKVLFAGYGSLALWNPPREGKTTSFDEVRVFNVAVGPKAISGLYGEGKGGKSYEEYRRQGGHSPDSKGGALSYPVLLILLLGALVRVRRTQKHHLTIS